DVGRGFGHVSGTLAVALGMYLAAGMLAWVQARLLNVTVQRTVVALRADVEDKPSAGGNPYFDSRQRGEILSRVTNDVDNIQTSLQMSINQLLSSMLTLVAVLAMMLSISPLLAVITLATVPTSLWITRAIARRSQQLFVAQWSNTGKLNAHIEETYSGFTIVKTYGHRAE
ncbi:ABC transporter permease, partial [Mycobacterium kubicae]|uniref:ABC transporter permease n=1 Tax=Mycobacterium kubicae TaxID=120959 RepID=UPI0021F29925